MALIAIMTIYKFYWGPGLSKFRQDRQNRNLGALKRQRRAIVKLHMSAMRLKKLYTESRWKGLLYWIRGIDKDAGDNDDGDTDTDADTDADDDKDSGYGSDEREEWETESWGDESWWDDSWYQDYDESVFVTIQIDRRHL